MKKAILITCVVAIAGLNSAAWADSLQIVRSIELRVGGVDPMYWAHGLAWDGEVLWCLADSPPMTPGPSDQPIYGINPLDGQVVAEIDRPFGMNYHGVAWDGSQLLCAGYISIVGLEVDTLPDYIKRYSRDGTLLGTSEAPRSPDAFPQGMAWDGASLWLADTKHGDVIRIDPVNHSVISSFAFPGVKPRGLAWDGRSLWGVDGQDAMIYRMDTAGNVLSAWSAPGPNPWGITYDGEHLWVLDNDTRRIHQLAVPEPAMLSLLALGGLAMMRRRRGR